MSMNAYDTHLEKGLGLPDEARDFRTSLRENFTALLLFPLAEISLAGTPAEVKASLLDAARLARARPDLLTDWMWKCLIMKEPTAPASANWFFPFFPMGTLFDMDHRPSAAHGRARFTPEQIADFRTEAPYSRALAYEAEKALGDKASLDAMSRTYGEMAHYDRYFARTLAGKTYGNTVEYTRRMEAVAEMSPVSRSTLAVYLADFGHIDAAVKQYERWLAESDSEVTISNRIDWLLRHYFESGEQQKATALAARAADTYSYRGLAARAALHEWRGETADAERLLKAADERYKGHSNELLGFYIRHRRQGPAVDALTSAIFPSGMKRVTTGALRGTPASGVRVDFAGETAHAQGLETGDVIVAVDGVRVDNFAQYSAMRSADVTPEMTLTVWRNGRYRAVPTRLRFWWAGTLTTHKAAAPAVPAARAAGK